MYNLIPSLPFLQEVVEVKKDVRLIQAQLQTTLSEASSSESQLQQSRQELKTEEERLCKLRSKVGFGVGECIYCTAPISIVVLTITVPLATG